MLLLVLTFKGFSQVKNDSLKLTVSEAQIYAVKNNRTVQASKIDLDVAKKQIKENLAQGFPQISADANYLHQFAIPKLSFGPYLDVNSLPDGTLTKEDVVNAYKEAPPISLGVKDNTTINLTLSQLVFNGQYFVGLQATRVVKEASQKALVKTEDQIKESVAGTYHMILVLQENIRLLKESMQTVEQTYNEMTKMNQQGLNEETDVDQIKINRSNIQTLITSLESQKEISEKRLKYQLGVGFDKQVVLTDSLSDIIKDGNLRYLSIPDFAVENNVDYQLIGLQEQISELNVKLEKSKFLPTLSAFYRHQEQTNQPSFNFSVKDVVGATLNIPIISSGMRSSRVSQAKYDLEKIRLNKQDTEQGLIMLYETARSNYRTTYSNFITNRESMALSKKIYDKTVIKFKEGVSTSFELTQNQNQFLTAESNYYNSLLSLLNAKAELDRILSTR